MIDDSLIEGVISREEATEMYQAVYQRLADTREHYRECEANLLDEKFSASVAEILKKRVMKNLEKEIRKMIGQIKKSLSRYQITSDNDDDNDNTNIEVETATSNNEHRRSNSVSSSIQTTAQPTPASQEQERSPVFAH